MAKAGGVCRDGEVRRFGLTSLVPLEHDIQRAIRDALERHPAVEAVYRINGGAKIVEAFVDEKGKKHPRRYVKNHDVPGMSDLWIWLKPRYGARQIFIEVKRPGKEPSDEQEEFLERARLRGHIAFWADDAADAWKRLSEELK